MGEFRSLDPLSRQDAGPRGRGGLAARRIGAFRDSYPPRWELPGIRIFFSAAKPVPDTIYSRESGVFIAYYFEDLLGPAASLVWAYLFLPRSSARAFFFVWV